jgi:hypothetical protein
VSDYKQAVLQWMNERCASEGGEFTRFGREGVSFENAELSDCDCPHTLLKLIDEAHAAGKREGIEAAAKLHEAFVREADESSDANAAYWSNEMARRIRALLQTEARAETGEGKRRHCIPLCGKYLGDNDGTCPQLTCIRPLGHKGLCDNL